MFQFVVDSGSQKKITGDTGKERTKVQMKDQHVQGHNPCQALEDSINLSCNAKINNIHKACEQDPYYHVLDVSIDTENSEKETKQEASAQPQHYHVSNISNRIRNM